MTEQTLPILISQKSIRARVAEMARAVEEDLGPPREEGAPPRMVVVLKGAFFFAADLAREIRRDLSIDFIHADSYGGSTESSGRVLISKDLNHDIAGVDVLLVEDIVDTGRTVRTLCDRLRRREPRSLRVATLLSKPSRRVEQVALSYTGFEIPDCFVVGYGLDHAGRYRNLADIRVLEPSGTGDPVEPQHSG
jgi:hypoxanthine phosphoribosyltransferase